MNSNSLEKSLQRVGRRAGLVLLAGWLTVPAPAQTNEVVKMPPPAPRRPSIILILADNIGYGDLGCYGQTKIKTPNLDKLATEGLRFTSFYTGSPEDAAARAALLTGMEPRHLHAGTNQSLPANVVTLAALLQRQGYRTGLIGTWGLGDTPAQQGFEQFAGFLSQSHARDYFTDRIWRHDPERGDAEMVFPQNEDGKRGQFLPDSMASWAINFVRSNKPEALNHYRPFFLCLSYPLPHVSADTAPPPGTSAYGDAPWPPLERLRATLISRMDDGIGQLLAKLDELKITSNTVVIFASVGGPEKDQAIAPEFFRSAGAFRGQQGSLNEGGLRVPLIVRWPAQIRRGGVKDVLCAGWDLFPTAAEIAFTTPSENLDGLSLLPTLLGQTQTNRHESVYWETTNGGFRQAVRLGEWKAIGQPTNAVPELYNLKTDPAEKENLAAKNPDVLARMEKLFKAARPESDRP